MSVVSSSPKSVDYHSLGVRKDWHYTAEEKSKLFSNAIDAIGRMLPDDTANDSATSSMPTSIPELVRRIFDDNNRDPDLEIIREALRPTSHLSLQSISATGQKLLALLATLQDENCFDDSGSLRVDYTKSLIRGWFKNSAKVELDDSALRNIKKDKTSKKISLGANRLADVTVKVEGTWNKN